MGLPGSGKGTLCWGLKEQGYSIIGLGSLLRKEAEQATEIGKQILIHINQGILIPDGLAVSLASQEIDRALNEKKPFAIEGFPSTVNQFHLFKNFLKERKISLLLIHLECTEEEALNRLTHRITCKKCERIFNSIFKPPANLSICECGGELFKRTEDTAECGKKRHETFKEKTQPIIDLIKEENGELIGIAPVPQFYH